MNWVPRRGMFLVVVIAIGVAVGAMATGQSGWTPVESPTPPFNPRFEPYDSVLSVEAMPAAGVVVAVGNAGVDSPAEPLCESLGLDRPAVAEFIGADADALTPVAAADGQAARCVWRLPADDQSFDGNGDDQIDAVSALVGLVPEASNASLDMVMVVGVVETPDGLTVRRSVLDPDLLEGVDPGVEMDLYELEVGTRITVSVADQVGHKEAVAGRVLDRVVSTLDESG